MQHSNNDRAFSKWTQLHILYKIIMALAAGLLASIIIPEQQLSLIGRILLGWDIFCIALIVFYWISFLKSGQSHIQKQAAEDDPSRIVIFILLLICTVAGMGAVILLLVSKNDSHNSKNLHLLIAVGGMVLTWVLVHTIFTVRYAHMYYRQLKQVKDKPLTFPGSEQPDFMDFAYFSFVLGMTFQVSDVSINSKKMRRWALLHGLISFAYNAVIIALTINIVASLR